MHFDKTFLGLVLVLAVAAISGGQDFEYKLPPAKTIIGQRIIAGYNPDDPSELVELLRQNKVCFALGLNDDQTKAMNDLFAQKKNLIREESMGLGSAERSLKFSLAKKELANRYLDEVLTVDQYQRLKNIAFRSEIESIGWAESISGGRLSDAVGVHDGQRTALHQRTTAIIAEHEAKILEIKKQMEIAILKELSAEQRDKAIKALGDFYDYKSETDGDVIREHTARINAMRSQKTKN